MVQVRCCNCGELYPEVFMNYPGPTCDGCEELERIQWEEYEKYERERRVT